jgi:hypothetical protein
VTGARLWRAIRLPLLLFALTRVVDAVLIVAAMHHQPALGVDNGQVWLREPMPAAPGYLTSLGAWDGQWYEQIALHGYPSSLPHTADGSVGANVWAFFPLYPALVWLVMAVSPASVALAGAIVSTTAACAAAVVLHRLVLRSGGPVLALGAVIALGTFPAAPVLQAVYSESLALLVVLICLWLLTERRYGWLCVGALVLGLTRPIDLPLAAVIAAHGWLRRGELHGRERRWWLAALASALVGFGLWPAIAGIATGDLTAYTETQKSWYSARDVGHFPSWFAHLPGGIGWAGVAILLVAVALAAGRWGRRWGVLRLWLPAYTLYLLALTRPIPSVVRFALLGGMPWVPLPARRGRAAVVLTVVAVVGFVLQWVWLRELYVADDTSGYP